MSEGIADVCTAFLFWLLLLSLRKLERLQTFSAVAKKLSIDRRLLSPLKQQKSVVSGKVRFEMLSSYSPSARLFEGIKMIEQVRIFKSYVGIFFILFCSWASNVKHTMCGDLGIILQMLLKLQQYTVIHNCTSDTVKSLSVHILLHWHTVALLSYGTDAVVFCHTVTLMHMKH